MHQDLWEKNKKLIAELSVADERAKAAQAETDHVKGFMREAHGKYTPEILNCSCLGLCFLISEELFFKQLR
jgi:hypothetical protein